MDDKKEFRFQCVNCGHCCTDKNTLVNVTYKDILLISAPEGGGSIRGVVYLYKIED